MTGIIVTICLVLAGLAVVWLSPLRGRVLKSTSVFDRFKFSCRVEQFSDESQPARNDQFFRVEMIGRIPTDTDGVDTDLRLEILDISDGQSQPQQILSTDEQFRLTDSAEFTFRKHNGIVPTKNAVLAEWSMVSEVPCHILRFACRGRRKLLFKVTILEAGSDRELVSASETLEYVYCSDGYREVHGRRKDVLRACVELAAIALDAESYAGDMGTFWAEWMVQKGETLISRDQADEMVKSIGGKLSGLSIKTSSEVVLAYGQNTDRFTAMEFALQSAVLSGRVTQKCFDKLFHIAGELEINRERFLGMAQKTLLSSDCKIEDPSQLFGLSRDMDAQRYRKRLNEEYRKWNARVTHPDPEIRRQADEILTLIAEIRSEQLRSCS